MNQQNVQHIAAFTKDGVGGNSAGVVLNSKTLSRSERQAIAAKAGYSETAFIDREGPILNFEYYTPIRQIEICGHATVGAFSIMRDDGLIDIGSHRFCSTLGTHQVELRRDSVGLWQELHRLESIDVAVWRKLIADAIGLAPRVISPSLRIVSTGSPFLLVEISNVELLTVIAPKFVEIEALSENLGVIGLYKDRKINSLSASS